MKLNYNTVCGECYLAILACILFIVTLLVVGVIGVLACTLSHSCWLIIIVNQTLTFRLWPVLSETMSVRIYDNCWSCIIVFSTTSCSCYTGVLTLLSIISEQLWTSIKITDIFSRHQKYQLCSYFCSLNRLWWYFCFIKK